MLDRPVNLLEVLLIISSVLLIYTFVLHLFFKGKSTLKSGVKFTRRRATKRQLRKYSIEVCKKEIERCKFQCKNELENTELKCECMIQDTEYECKKIKEACMKECEELKAQCEADCEAYQAECEKAMEAYRLQVESTLLKKIPSARKLLNAITPKEPYDSENQVGDNLSVSSINSSNLSSDDDLTQGVHMSRRATKRHHQKQQITPRVAGARVRRASIDSNVSHDAEVLQFQVQGKSNFASDEEDMEL
jgi:F0F1-type ATP synthase membrane subunit b/b'